MKRLVYLGLLMSPGMFAACECENTLQNLTAQGELDPAVYSFGVVRAGATCTATIKVKNVGQQDLAVNGAAFEDDNSGGLFTVSNFPTETILSGGEGEVIIRYAPTQPSNGVQVATLALNTNDPDNGGKVSGQISGEAVTSAAGKLLPLCKVTLDSMGDPGLCRLMEFGATPKLNPGQAGGLTRTITVKNDGTAVFNILNVQVLPSDGSTTQPEFTVDLVNNAPWTGAAVAVQPSRTGDCGEPAMNVQDVPVTIRFAPTTVGIQTARVQIVTDAPTAGTGDGNPGIGIANVTVTGIGSGVGLGLDPEFIAFGSVAAGASETRTVRVANLDINPAAVNSSCIDINDNGTCYSDPQCTSGCSPDPGDIECTGGTADPSTGLNCDVVGQGKGFALTATDAMPGGTDEATINVIWAPPAAASFSKALLLMTNIQNNRVYSVRLTGGVAGNIVVEPSTVVVPANSDTVSATGMATFTVRNTGQAELIITRVAFENASMSITDDYTLTRDADGAFMVTGATAWTTPFTLPVNGSSVFTVAFADNDAAVSLQDMNIAFTHNGSGGSPFNVDVTVCKPQGGTSNRPTCP